VEGHQHLPLMMPVVVIGMAFMVAGIIIGVISVRAGHFRDPEEAKFHLPDDHPEAPADRPTRP
jgi:hypothetical protein